jgi:hypothetical protein
MVTEHGNALSATSISKRRCHGAFGRFALSRRGVVSGLGWRFPFLPANFLDAFETLDGQPVLSPYLLPR